MTTTPSICPTAPATGKRVVCGTETATRCQECAKVGTDWMFFCSTEHQKLIWFMHRRVCGSKSNPFEWPYFSNNEIDEMVCLGNQPIQFGSNPSYTWFDKYGDEQGLPKLEGYRRMNFKEEFERLKDSNVNHSRTPEETTSIIKYRANAFHYRRAALTSVHPDADSAQIMATAVQHRPFDFATSVYELTKLDELFPCDPPKWFSTLQHVFLVWIGLAPLGALKDQREAHSDLESSIDFAAGRVRKLARIHLAPEHPKKARILYKVLDQVAKGTK